MNAFFFGRSDAQLYGVFHQANPDSYRGRAVLLLYPFGHEYMRIHRAYRRLADILSKGGMDALRFDYAGTGDSHGDFASARLSHWVDSAVAAYDELASLAPNQPIDVIALRAGTVIAAALADRRNIARLVMWEPKLTADAYLREYRDDIAARGATRSNFLDGGVLHYNGYAYSGGLQADLAPRSWADLGRDRLQRLLALGDTTCDDMARLAEQAASDFDVVRVTGPTDWIRVDSMGGIFLPEKALDAIRAWLLA